jgi:hypothetical protein
LEVIREGAGITSDIVLVAVRGALIGSLLRLTAGAAAGARLREHGCRSTAEVTSVKATSTETMSNHGKGGPATERIREGRRRRLDTSWNSVVKVAELGHDL